MRGGAHARARKNESASPVAAANASVKIAYVCAADLGGLGCRNVRCEEFVNLLGGNAGELLNVLREGAPLATRLQRAQTILSADWMFKAQAFGVVII